MLSKSFLTLRASSPPKIFVSLDDELTRLSANFVAFDMAPLITNFLLMG
jgi:hypothetical protein